MQVTQIDKIFKYVNNIFMEKSLILIKPDGIARGLLPIILSYIENCDLVISEQKFLTATEEQCRKHHSIKNRSYGATEEQIVDYLSRSYIKNKNICVLKVVGENAISKTYQVKMKIRNDFVIDTLEKCHLEKRALHNVMHSSETAEEAEEEIEIWLKK